MITNESNRNIFCMHFDSVKGIGLFEEYAKQITQRTIKYWILSETFYVSNRMKILNLINFSANSLK